MLNLIKNRGYFKVLVMKFLILLLLNISLFANVILNSSNSFVKGEPFVFEYEAIGNSISFPKIESIDGYLVQTLGSSRSLHIINNNYNDKITKRFKILPKDDFTIPSFIFKIDGKEIKTKQKKIFAKKIVKTISNNFDLTLKPSKTIVYVGEELLVKLIFKYRKNLQIIDLRFEKPHFNNFWSKKIDNSNKRYEENNYIVQELDFLLFPQKSGELVIEPLRVDVQMIDNSSSNNFGFFAMSPKVKKVYSNELKFEVKELPSGIDYIGDFEIDASIDKLKVKQGESISYRVNIKGVGNFDDIQDINLDIPNATIYDNKPEITTKYVNSTYEGNFSKVYSIVPSKSLEIPSLSFKYFSKKEQKIVEKRTKSFKIEVEEKDVKKVVLEKPTIKNEVKEKVVIKKESFFKDRILFFILGVIFTLLIIGLYTYVKLQKVKKSKNDTSLIKQIKKAKDKQELMKWLAPFIKKDDKLDSLIYECQSNKEFKVLKKEILVLLEDLKI